MHAAASTPRVWPEDVWLEETWPLAWRPLPRLCGGCLAGLCLAGLCLDGLPLRLRRRCDRWWCAGVEPWVERAEGVKVELAEGSVAAVCGVEAPV